MKTNNVAYIAFQSILTKEITRFFRIWVQTLLPPAITMMLYFLIFGHLMGSRIGMMDGRPYIEYIVPGLIMMAVITNAYANVVSSFFSSKFGRYVEELLIAPVPNVVILMGYVAGGVCRGLLVGIIVMWVAWVFADISVVHPWIMLSTLVLSAIVFSLGGFINAVYAKKFDDISIIPTFILTPLTYLGGVFYSIKLLPESWQIVSLSNPILYMVNAFRFSMLGVSDVPISHAFILLLLLATALFAYAMILLHKGIGLRS